MGDSTIISASGHPACLLSPICQPFKSSGIKLAVPPGAPVGTVAFLGRTSGNGRLGILVWNWLVTEVKHRPPVLWIFIRLACQLRIIVVWLCVTNILEFSCRLFGRSLIGDTNLVWPLKFGLLEATLL